MKIVEIYNLEFPPYIEELKIGNYTFKRILNYEENFHNMSFYHSQIGSEFQTTIKDGSHQITATIELPFEQKESKITGLNNNKLTQLDDILLLLTIFTGRNIFKKTEEKYEYIILEDHLQHFYGAQLRHSIKYESMWKDKLTGSLKTQKEVESIQFIHNHYNQVNIGFEKTINEVMHKISSVEWQNQYDGGFFLLLFKSAIGRQSIETTFIICWTIWEHVYTLRNKGKLSEKEIEKISGDKKIKYILSEYFLVKKIEDSNNINIVNLKNTRNRIMHYGKKTKDISFDEIEMFIRLTEQLIAIILGLPPSDILNSSQELNIFLNKKN